MTRLYLDLFLTTIGRSKTKNFFFCSSVPLWLEGPPLSYIFTRIFSSSFLCVCVFRFDPLSFRFQKGFKIPSIHLYTHTTHYPAKYPLGLNLLSLTLLNISEKEKKKTFVLLLSLPFFLRRKRKK